MRRSVLVAASCAALFSAPAAQADEPAPSNDAGRVRTSDQANRESIQGAAQAPLRDLNVVRTKIPAVLQEAIADPYKRPAIQNRFSRKAQCAQLAELIRPLDNALGADLDTPSKDEDDLLDKGRGLALGAAASFASDAIPFRGWVRKLTGAEKHDRLVTAAIIAGGVRRGYLKGLGEARGCDPPATPSHVLTGLAEEAAKTKQEPEERRRLKSRYPPR